MKYKLYNHFLISVCFFLLGFSQPYGVDQLPLLKSSQLRIEKGAAANTPTDGPAQASESLFPNLVPLPAAASSSRPRALARAARLEKLPETDSTRLRLLKFIETVKDERKKGSIVGLFAAHTFASPVVQQPADNLLYVSTQASTLTQFRRAQQAGTTGLLAHNYLAGAQFFNLRTGSQLYRVQGDGSYRLYEVFAIEDYQALTLTSFRDLSTGKAIGQYPLFDRIYRSKNDRLVLQTCIEKNGASSWGRRFILAKPVAERG
jgi:hypothetical protein